MKHIRPANGDRVRIKPGWKCDNCGKVCGPLKTGETGLVVQDDGSSTPFQVKNEDSGDCGWFKADAIERAPSALPTAATALAVGAKVRVKPSVASPRHEWGRVNSASVGTVVSISGDSCVINFPEQNRWNGAVSEMEEVAQ